MRTLREFTATTAFCFVCGVCVAQDIGAVNDLWKQTLAAVQRGDDRGARASLARFTSSASAYVAANGRSWKIEYLVGSLDCMFADKRAVGAEFLTDILENNRTLNAGGEAELRRQIASCSGPARTMPSSTQPNTPPDVNEVSTHYQAVGVSGSMKGGGNRHWSNESAAAASPIPPAELTARLVAVNQPERALQGALRRLPATARGSAVEGFAVAAVDGSPLQAQRTGACLKQYADPLKQEFQIASSQYMVTAYSVPNDAAVYEYAQKLHGLDLPIGVIAYSVPDDMSLVSTDKGSICGSMAHELVHLLIRQSFPGAPAWLEEGLASEVAIAAPTPQSLRFGWSWRDQKLQIHDNEIPTVSDLLKMPWSALSAYHESEAWDVEAKQAMAAVFIRYLDYRGKLRAIYFRARDQHVGPDLSSVMSYEAIVEQELGTPVSEIDGDFRRWFAAQGAQHPLAGFESTENDAPAGATHPSTGGALNRAAPNASPNAAHGCVEPANASRDAPPHCAPNAPQSGNEPPRANESATPNRSATPNESATPNQSADPSTPAPPQL